MVREGGLCLTFDTGVHCWSSLPSVAEQPCCLLTARDWLHQSLQDLRLWPGPGSPRLRQVGCGQPVRDSPPAAAPLPFVWFDISPLLKREIVSTQLLRPDGRHQESDGKEEGKKKLAWIPTRDPGIGMLCLQPQRSRYVAGGSRPSRSNAAPNNFPKAVEAQQKRLGDSAAHHHLRIALTCC